MRKYLLFLFANSLLFAQNQELFSNSWYISKMVINGQTIITPVMDLPPAASTFRTVGTSDIVYNSGYFNTCQMGITFIPNTNSFTKSSSACTLAEYDGSNAVAATDYDVKHMFFSTYPAAGSTFNYEIISNGSGNTLIVTNPTNGNQIYYNNSYLATKETKPVKNVFKTYPNPVKADLSVENIPKGLPVRIFDMQGKLVYETISNEEKLNIKTESLPKGQYILSVENHKPSSFIKE
ncbi:MAG: T9SS type A sorting domain-containing protein [Chryseobacterium sp.]|jgi:hypothetical protein|uniref:T9SS type A sorting domain-containing protein n=1 Tax=Chryseobacterium sp. TaxID=1871047 RepID=UPI002820F504|nr:T9SS type A sorting domain-containing protein [Chryseobacterium sp.]MDR2235751.1 T9SS type A sorting domain-containing protein [Chryseobacterium sp.]